METRTRPGAVLAGVGVLLLAVACQTHPDAEAIRIVDRSIERHGGALFEDSRIRFTFRNARFEVLRDDGRYHYERRYEDPMGRPVVESMDNDGTYMEVDGASVPLDPAERSRVETAVNSTVYFGFLPFRLRDPSARLHLLESDEIAGVPYHRVEVTFAEDGGGADWDDRFVYWIHAEDYTLDYLAYRYHRDGGGTRFRRAIQRREVGGLLLQDYENLVAIDSIADISDYSRRMEAGTLESISLVELENVEVIRADEAWPEGDVVDPPPPEAGLEVQLGIDRPTYSVEDSVRAVLQVVNRTAESTELAFPTSQRFEFVVLTPDGTEVYRWSDEHSFLQVLEEVLLDSEGELSYEVTLPAPQAPGSYHLQGRIPATGMDLEATLPLEVVD